jgi:hypothetical protein
MTIKKLSTPTELFPVYNALMEFLKVAGYDTETLTISQMSAIKLNVMEAIEATELEPSKYIKELGLDGGVAFRKIAGE